MTPNQRYICDFGRKMMNLAQFHENDKISNELARVGNILAETATLKNLTELDEKIIRYARSKMS